jgi:nucleotide-binding universal stress UspA family protein
VVVSAYGATGSAAAVVPEAIAAMGDGRDLADDALKIAQDDLKAAGVECDVRAVIGSPADAIVDVAKLESASHIVVGSRGMRGVGRVLGSVPNRVSHKAPCSVLIVKTD